MLNALQDHVAHFLTINNICAGANISTLKQKSRKIKYCKNYDFNNYIITVDATKCASLE
jgi:hypothetical protein